MMTMMLGFLSCACSGLPAQMSAAVAVSKDRPKLTTFNLYFTSFLFFFLGISGVRKRYLVSDDSLPIECLILRLSLEFAPVAASRAGFFHQQVNHMSEG